MNVTDYTYLINKPDVITEKQTEALGNVLNEFPYFQSARALRLKGLHNQNSFKYNYALKVTAAHTADRSVLFDFITSETFTSIQNDFFDKKLRDLLDITVLDSEVISPEEIKKSFETRIDPIEQSILTSIKQATSNGFEEPVQTEGKTEETNIEEGIVIPIQENETAFEYVTETEQRSQDLIIEEAVAIPIEETQPVSEEEAAETEAISEEITIVETFAIPVDEKPVLEEEVPETEAISEEIIIEETAVIPTEETIVIPVKESRPTFFEEVVVEDEIFDPVIEKPVLNSNEETSVEDKTPTAEEKATEVRIDPIEESIYNSIKEATTVVFESKPIEEQQAVIEEQKFIEEYPKEVATLVFDEVKPLETDSNEVEPVVLETIPTEETPEKVTFILEEPVFIEAEPEIPVVSEKAEVIEAEPIDFTTVFAQQPKEIEQLPEETPSQETVKIAEENLEIGKPLDFSVSEKHSFQEWLQLARPEPIDRSNEIIRENTKAKEEIVKEAPKTPEIILPQIEKVEKVEIVEDEKKKKAQIIDQFIAANPKIPPIKPTPITLPPVQFDINQDDNTYLMTETLARVYLEQKKYTKAIQAYEILILKYPEKISFFADRISDIKILQQNNNNN